LTSSPSTLTSPEERFHALAAAGRSIFLTGAAGTGKSFQIDRFTSANPGTDVTASTGVAALNVGGMTIHRWAGMLLGPGQDECPRDFFDRLSSDPRRGVQSGLARVRSARRVVIDEISMLPGRLLEYFDFHCRMARGSNRPFGGIQIISTGDFLQLPPVRVSPTQSYDWAFEAPVWQRAAFETVQLTKVRRQDDPDFIRVLASLRAGRLDGDAESILRPRVSHFPDRSWTRLLTHNVQVDRWNDYCLGELPGAEKVLEAVCTGTPDQVAFLEKNLLTPRTLRLKEGARVIFTLNRPDDGFVNGQTGTVTGFRGGTVIVESEGSAVAVEPWTWRVDPKDRNSASFTQFPLRLAYAMTIHKAQGLSLDAAFIDIRAAREPGQAYVAVSRVRSLAGLHLKDWPRGLFVSVRALDFHRPTQ
jgi:hypothetical protein